MYLLPATPLVQHYDLHDRYGCTTLPCQSPSRSTWVHVLGRSRFSWSTAVAPIPFHPASTTTSTHHFRRSSSSSHGITSKPPVLYQFPTSSNEISGLVAASRVSVCVCGQQFRDRSMKSRVINVHVEARLPCDEHKKRPKTRHTKRGLHERTCLRGLRQTSEGKKIRKCSRRQRHLPGGETL